MTKVTKKHDAGTTRSTCTPSPFLPRAGPNRADPNRNSTFHKKEKEKDQKDHVHCGSEQPGIQKRKIILPFDRRCPKPKKPPAPSTEQRQPNPITSRCGFFFLSFSFSVCVFLSLLVGKKRRKSFFLLFFSVFRFFVSSVCPTAVEMTAPQTRQPKTFVNLLQ